MKADNATFGPFLNSALRADRILSVTIKSGETTEIDSSTYDNPVLRYWVIIYTSEQEEYIRYRVTVPAVKLTISNTERNDLTLLLTHWKETSPGVIEQCDLTPDK